VERQEVGGRAHVGRSAPGAARGMKSATCPSSKPASEMRGAGSAAAAPAAASWAWGETHGERKGPETFECPLLGRGADDGAPHNRHDRDCSVVSGASRRRACPPQSGGTKAPAAARARRRASAPPPPARRACQRRRPPRGLPRRAATCAPPHGPASALTRARLSARARARSNFTNAGRRGHAAAAGRGGRGRGQCRCAGAGRSICSASAISDSPLRNRSLCAAPPRVSAARGARPPHPPPPLPPPRGSARRECRGERSADARRRWTRRGRAGRRGTGRSGARHGGVGLHKAGWGERGGVPGPFQGRASRART